MDDVSAGVDSGQEHVLETAPGLGIVQKVWKHVVEQLGAERQLDILAS